MSKIVVLFNLKDDASAADYEQWAKTTDLPTVRGLKSVDNFEVFRTTGLMGSTASPPYQYVEILDVKSLEMLGQDVATDTMQKVAAEFQTFADNPLFILTDPL